MPEMFANQMDPWPDDLVPAIGVAAARLGGRLSLHYFAEVGSTNDVALALAANGGVEGVAVLADVQTAGRGRLGRSWFSPPGAGLYLSAIVNAKNLQSSLSLVTLAAGVAAADAIGAATGLAVELKWPNDLVIGRPWRKLGGILCESTGVAQAPHAIVIGVGINLRPAAYPPDVAVRATSLESELGRPVDRSTLVVECLVALDNAMVALRRGRGADVRDRWRRFGRAGLGGAPVRWRDGDDDAAGHARDIDDDGALIVERAGSVERLVAGEVSWDRLSRE